MRILAAVAALLLTGSLPAPPQVIGVTLDGVIHPISVEIVGHALEQAERENAQVLLIRLNTPGGLLEATREITAKIVASPIPVVTYVTPSGGRAASAGFFILEAGNIAAMAPSTNTGAASPVLLGQEMDPVMRSKVENDAAAALRSVTEQRGRNSALAETAVREAKAFTEKEALDQNLIDLIAPSEAELLKQIRGREVKLIGGATKTIQLANLEITDYELTMKETVIAALSDPNLAFILLILGGLGVYVEFSSPGLILPGVAGGILVVLSLSALAILPINWGGVALLLLALVLFALEAKFTSGGILGIGGAVAMALGAVLLIDAPPDLRIQWPVAIAVTIPFALITMFLVTLVVRARAAKSVTGAGGMIGGFGEASSALAPAGTVFFDGTYWRAISTEPVDKGAKVRVVDIDGLTLRVEPASKGDASHG